MLSKICYWVAVCVCVRVRVCVCVCVCEWERERERVRVRAVVMCLSLFSSFFYYFSKFEIMNHHILHIPCVFFTQVHYISPVFHTFICVV